MNNNVCYQGEKIKFDDVIEKNVNLSEFTNFKTGGNAEFVATPGRFSELIAALKFAEERKLNITIMGDGSNTLVSDKGIEGLVIRTKHLSRYSSRGNMFCCRAGMTLEKAITLTLEDGMEGLEFLSGIQGSIGGAIAGNSGAYGHCISDHLLYVDYVTFDGKTHRMGAQVIDFGYRYSPFMDMRDCIIFEVGFLLPKSQDFLKNGKDTQLALKQERRNKGYFDFPSAGSVFKNPEGSLTAGQMLDECNMKLQKIGDAMVSKKHANLIVNTGHAKSSDIYQLALKGKDEVKKKFNVDLEFEIKLLGDFS